MVNRIQPKPAVFLDRDGTICEEVGYLDHPDKLRLIPGAAEAIRKLREAGFWVFVTTNQSGVARGYFTESVVQNVHERLNRLLAEAGACVDAYFYCPHHPNAVFEQYRQECRCRKPNIGMIEQAVAQFPVELDRSFTVGDKLSDCEFGRNAGLIPILVRTGYGRDEELRVGAGASPCQPAVVVDDLAHAVEWILSNPRGLPKVQR